MNDKIESLDELRIAVEDAAEQMIFRHAHLISAAEQEETWAKNLPVAVLRDGNIIEIAPDRSERIIGKSKARRRKVTEQTFIVKWKQND